MERWTGILGIAVFVGVAWLLSTKRSAVRWRLVAIGLALQVALAWLLLKVDFVVWTLDRVARVVNGVISSAAAGGEFIFGGLADQDGPGGFIFAVQALPVIIFFGALMAVLYHIGVMQRIVVALAWCLRRTMGISGAEALSVAANVFVGQTEAPLVVRPYIAKLTQSQLALLMTGGFATIAGSVLAAFVGMLGGTDEAMQVEFAKHLLTASVMSAPGAFVIAKILLPETEEQMDELSLQSITEGDRTTVNVLDAAAAGATDGLRLALNVAAMLVAFVALIAMIDWPLGAMHGTWLGSQLEALLGLDQLSLIGILGVLFSPIAVFLGVDSKDVFPVGELLGTSMVATEFLAYIRLSDRIADGTISHRSAVIVTYALCGFANFPSIAIQIGGLTAIAPERRSDFARIGPRAMLGGALTCWMTGCITSLFLA